MKKIIYLISLALISSAAIGQKADFSGTWKINNEKSELGDQFSMAPNSLVVEQTKKELSIQRNSSWQGEDYSFTDKFTLDGEECENMGMMDMVKKSTVVWNDDKRSLKITSTIEMQDGSDLTIIENLSMKGDNLVVEASASSSYGDMSEVFVFDKQ
jgi:uncharacterized Zn ribbon protein